MPSPFQRVPRLVTPSTSRYEVMASKRRIRSVQVSRARRGAATVGVGNRTAAQRTSRRHHLFGQPCRSHVARAVGFLIADVLVGVVVTAGAVCCLGPLVAIPTFVIGTSVGGLVIQHKRLSDTGIDPKFWEDVFGTTLPSEEQIILTDLAGLNGRAFMPPNIVSSGLINLGNNFADHVHDVRRIYVEPYQLLIHELVHVWYITQRYFSPGIMRKAIVAHKGNVIGKFGAIYAVPLGIVRYDFGIERQATLIDQWFAAEAKPDHPSPASKATLSWGPDSSRRLRLASRRLTYRTRYSSFRQMISDSRRLDSTIVSAAADKRPRRVLGVRQRAPQRRDDRRASARYASGCDRRPRLYAR